MTKRFLQIHLLTSYPPANLNRDDLGRPKTAIMGGTTRLRISSQSLKRAWRKSELFTNAFEGLIGTRTRKMIEKTINHLKSKNIDNIVIEQLEETLFEKVAKKDTIIHFSDVENSILCEKSEYIANKTEEYIKSLTSSGKKREKEIKEFIDSQKNDLSIFVNTHKNIDISLFGRMLTSSPAHNMEAACQVAHAISVHKVALEDDYFTAVDDLNAPGEDSGSAHIGITEFAAGLFYLYVCIDRKLLLKNLQEDEQLMAKTLSTFIEAITTISPTGKQNSFASRARASYVLVEKGEQQPRSLSAAFLKSIHTSDMLSDSIQALTQLRVNMNDIYGDCADELYEMNVLTASGKLSELKDFMGN